VDFRVLATRNAMYRAAERRSLEEFERDAERELADLRTHCRLAEAAPAAPAGQAR